MSLAIALSLNGVTCCVTLLEDILASGTVPDAKSDASKFVKFAPLIAGSVPVKFAAGKLVKSAPLPVGLPVKFPTNVVAVTTPDITCGPVSYTHLRAHET